MNDKVQYRSGQRQRHLTTTPVNYLPTTSSPPTSQDTPDCNDCIYTCPWLGSSLGTPAISLNPVWLYLLILQFLGLRTIISPWFSRVDRVRSLVDSCLDGDNLHSFAVRLPCFSSNTVDHYIAKDQANAQSRTSTAAEAAHGEDEGARGCDKAEAVEESEWYENLLWAPGTEVLTMI